MTTGPLPTTYRRKPTVVEAWRWSPGADLPGLRHDPAGVPFVLTRGRVAVYPNPGDWVVRLPDGSYAAMGADYFAAEFEAAPGGAE